MQLAYRHDERPGESYEALDGKKFLLLQGYLVNDAAQQFVGCVTFEDEESETREGGSSWDLMVVC